MFSKHPLATFKIHNAAVDPQCILFRVRAVVLLLLISCVFLVFFCVSLAGVLFCLFGSPFFWRRSVLDGDVSEVGPTQGGDATLQARLLVHSNQPQPTQFPRGTSDSCARHRTTKVPLVIASDPLFFHSGRNSRRPDGLWSLSAALRRALLHQPRRNGICLRCQPAMCFLLLE